MDDLISRQAALEKVRAMQTYKLFVGDDMILVDKAEVQTELMMLPPVQPEPTRIIPETRAIPSDDDRVSLSERITATYYDDEYEEWSQRTVTVRDVLDSVCDEYTVLPTIQPEPQWIPCSERMPEDLAEVITTWVNRDPLPYYEFMRDKPFTAVSVHYKGEWYWYSSTCADYLEEYGRSDRDKVDKSIEIIAWMPLPTPYTK